MIPASIKDSNFYFLLLEENTVIRNQMSKSFFFYSLGRQVSFFINFVLDVRLVLLFLYTSVQLLISNKDKYLSSNINKLF